MVKIPSGRKLVDLPGNVKTIHLRPPDALPTGYPGHQGLHTEASCPGPLKGRISNEAGTIQNALTLPISSRETTDRASHERPSLI